MNRLVDLVGRAHRSVHVRVLFEPRDIWCGLYWTVEHVGCDRPDARYLTNAHWHRERHFYICLLPMLPIHIWWRDMEGVA